MTRSLIAILTLAITACATSTAPTADPGLTPLERLDRARPYVEGSLQVACASIGYLGSVLTAAELEHARSACEALRLTVDQVMALARLRLSTPATPAVEAPAPAPAPDIDSTWLPSSPLEPTRPTVWLLDAAWRRSRAAPPLVSAVLLPWPPHYDPLIGRHA